MITETSYIPTAKEKGEYGSQEYPSIWEYPTPEKYQAQWYSPEYASKYDRPSIDHAINLMRLQGHSNWRDVQEQLMAEGIDKSVAYGIARDAYHYTLGPISTTEIHWAKSAGWDVDKYQQTFGVTPGMAYEPFESAKHIGEMETLRKNLHDEAYSLYVERGRLLGYTDEEITAESMPDQEWLNRMRALSIPDATQYRWLAEQEELLRHKASDFNSYLIRARRAFDVSSPTAGIPTERKPGIADEARAYYDWMVEAYPEEFGIEREAPEAPPTPPIRGLYPELGVEEEMGRPLYLPLAEAEEAVEAKLELPWTGQIKTNTGETIDVEIQEDKTVWAEGAQIAVYDPKTDEIRAIKAPTELPSQIGEPEPEWMKQAREPVLAAAPPSPEDVKVLLAAERGVETAVDFTGQTFAAGIQVIEDYIEKPIGMILLRSFYDETRNNLDMKAHRDWLAGMAVGGETRKKYEEWMGPEVGLFFKSPFTDEKARLGLKESIEFSPWILVGTGAWGASAKIAAVPGRVWRVARMTRGERLAQMLKGARTIKAAKEELFKIAPNEKLVGRALRVNDPHKLIPDAFSLEGRVLDQIDALAYLSQLKAMRFGISVPGGRRIFKVTKDWIIKPNKHITPKIKGKEYHLIEILENPSLVRLSPQGRHFLHALQESLNDITRLLKQEGISIREIAVGGAGQPEVYIPRFVLEKAGVQLNRASGYLSGLGSLNPKARRYLLAIEGIEATGIKYVEEPLEFLTLAWLAASKRIARKRAAEALQPLTKWTVTEANQARALVKSLEQLAAGKTILPARLEAIKKQFPAIGEQIELALKPKPMPAVLGGEITVGEIETLRFELEGLREWLSMERAASLVGLLKKVGWYKGEIRNLTLKQYRTLTGKTPSPSSLTVDGRHIRWEYALDDVATELGYKSGDELRYAIEAAKGALDKTKALEVEISSLEGLIAGTAKAIKPAADTDALKVILEQAKGIQAERTAIYAQAMRIQEKAAAELVQARKTVRNIQKAIRGMDVTEAVGYDLAKVLSPEQSAILTKVQQALILARAPQRRTLNEQLRVANQALNKAELAFVKARGTKKTMIQAASQELGEARVPLGGFGNRVFKNITVIGKNGKPITITGQQVVDRIVKKFGDRVSWAIHLPNNISSSLRLFKASLDASPSLIQLVIHSVRHPSAWGEAFTRGVWNYIDPVYTARWLSKPENFKAGLEFAYHRGMLTFAEFTEAAGLITRGAKAVPGIGKYLSYLTELTFGRGNQVFSGTRTIGAINIWKGMSPYFKKIGKLDEFALFLNRSTGFFSLRGMGVRAQMREFLSAYIFFAPRFTFAMGSTLADIAKGGVKTRLALEHLGSMIMGMHLLYFAACQASGQKPKLDPRPKSAGGDGADYGSFLIGDTRISPLSGIWSMMRAFVGIGADVFAGEFARIPQDILRALRARTAPFTSYAVDVITGRSYIGEPTRESWEGFGKYTGTRFVPIWIEGTWQAMQEGEKVGALTAIATMEFVGGRTYPEFTWDKVEGLRHQYIQEIPESDLTSYQLAILRSGEALTWQELRRDQRDEIRRLHPDLTELEEEAKKESLERWGSGVDRAISEITEEVVNERDEGLDAYAQAYLAGQITLEEYIDRRSYLRPYYSGARAVLYRFREELDPESVKALEEAIALIETTAEWEDASLFQYWEIANTIIKDPETRVIDWEVIRASQEAYITQLPLETQGFIREHKGDWIKDLPNAARKVEELIADCRENLDDYYAVEKGTPRLEYRERHPDMDAQLVVLYGYKPRSSASEDEIVKLLEKHDVPEVSVPQLGELRVTTRMTIGSAIAQAVSKDPSFSQALIKFKTTKSKAVFTDKQLDVLMHAWFDIGHPDDFDKWLREELPKYIG